MNPCLSSYLIPVVITALLAACTPLPPRAGAPAQWVPSPNFDARRPNLVVIHHTSNDTMASAVRTLTTPERKVSAHYVIGRDGTLLQLVDETARAWHAGKSWWAGMTDINSVSLGIELDNNGSEPFAETQIDALLLLLADIRQRNRIPRANFIGHADVAPSRKDDPSKFFPWQRLAEQGFGLWCDPPYPPVPSGLDLSITLAALGYDPGSPEASRRAFRRHFIGNGENDPFTLPEDEEKALAYCLLQMKANGQQ